MQIRAPQGEETALAGDELGGAIKPFWMARLSAGGEGRSKRCPEA
jgi:hypothetical protein